MPLSPVGREEIHKLEAALLVGTLFRPEVLQALKDPSERLTWVDSLAVAAAALARQKAGMSVTAIAEELGRTEATIRGHLTGKTKAGQLVQQTYERFVKEGVKIEVTPAVEESKLREELEEERRRREEAERRLQELIKGLEELVNRFKA
ncbi:regulator [Candidatus Geothermarchaeota archaeon ex4572_27]|nr:MAG: regulator [Candidatus Geothermarchaeota archaeon ex4572_27]